MWRPTDQKAWGCSPNEAGHRAVGHAPAGHARHGGLPPDARHRPGTDRDGQCRRHRARRGARAGVGSGGLRDQALPSPRAGGPHAGHPAACLTTAGPLAATAGSGPDGRRPHGHTHDDAPPITAFGTIGSTGGARSPSTVTRPICTAAEVDLLAVLLTPARRVRTRGRAHRPAVAGPLPVGQPHPGTHIHRLRAKLEPDPAQPEYILTVRGVGFRIEPDGTHPTPLATSTFRAPGDVPGPGSAGRGRPVPA